MLEFVSDVRLIKHRFTTYCILSFLTDFSSLFGLWPAVCAVRCGAFIQCGGESATDLRAARYRQLDRARTTFSTKIGSITTGRSSMALFTCTAKLDPGVHGARCARAMAVHHAVGISCQRNSGYRPSRVNIMAQGLSTSDPSLSPTHLSIRRGRAATTHYTHTIRLA